MDRPIIYCILGFLLIAMVTLIGIMYDLMKPEPDKSTPAPVGYRYLQKCDEGVTVEYRSFKKLPKLHVCGE